MKLEADIQKPDSEIIEQPDLPESDGSRSIENVRCTVRGTSYVPYKSAAVPYYQLGKERGREILDMCFSGEIQSSVEASAVMKTIKDIVAILWQHLWPVEGRGSTNGLANVSAIAPRKGGEFQRYVKHYLGIQTQEKKDVIPMILRDFYASTLSWMFIRCTDGRILDLAGSLMCMSLGPDYSDTSDNPGIEGYSQCFIAASEGVFSFTGPATTQLFRDIVIACAVIVAKERFIESLRQSPEPSIKLKSCKDPITPEEYRYARWWDGGLAGTLRSVWCTRAYQHITDNRGTFESLEQCENIKRALDNITRYNDILDFMSDYYIGEPMNEACVALALGGRDALYGHGNACARVTDDTLACKCGAKGHQEAAEISMGFNIWECLLPRYIGPQQLRYYAAASKTIREAYAWPPAGSRLGSVANIRLEPGGVLHTDSWQPLWKRMSPSDYNADKQAMTRDIAYRIARRCLTTEPDEDTVRHIDVAASSVLINCDALEDIEKLRGLSFKWSNLFKTVLECTSLSDACVPIAEKFGCLIRRTWDHAVIGVPQSKMADEADVQLFVDIDVAIRESYLLPAAGGIFIRRAFMGVTSSAIELSGLGPYARLIDGTARMHNQWKR